MKMQHSIQHALEPERAKGVLDRALDTYRQHYAEYGVETAWLDEETAAVGFETTGGKVDGEIKVCKDCFDIHLKLPWMMRPFRKRIARTFDQEFQRWLARA
jgi:hypothetical protein